MSFVELELILKEKKLVQYLQGNEFQINHPYYTNLVYWISKNYLLIRATNELSHEKQISIKQCDIEVYRSNANENNMDLPVADQIYHYTKPHWLPVMVSINHKHTYASTKREEKEEFQDILNLSQN